MDKKVYYKVLKLKTGDSIICSMENDITTISSENYLILQDPVQVIQSNESTKGNMIVGENYLLKPWMGLSDSDEFSISIDIVLTIGELKKQVKDQYVNYIEHTKLSKKRLKERQDIDDAVYGLLKEVNNGKDVYIIDDDLIYGDNEDEQ